MEVVESDATYNDTPFNPLANTTFDADLPLPAEWTVGLFIFSNDKLLFT